MIIGCITMVRFERKIVAINCSKGRGTIMPGGKWQPGETFVECARREFFEETGMDAYNFRLVFQGVSEDGAYIYAFTAEINDYLPKDSPEGEVTLASWHKLKMSKYRAFYELMQHVIGEPL